MRCPYCDNSDSRVIDSRDAGDGIRRRRECVACERRYTTYEYIQMRSIMVVKRDGRREEFQREKLFSSLSKACAKRPLPVGSIDKVVDEIERQLIESGRAEFSSRAIGEAVNDEAFRPGPRSVGEVCKCIQGLQGHRVLQGGHRCAAGT